MDATAGSQLVVFALGGEAYALPIAQVHEIIRHVEPRRVASADPRLTGVISLRGRIVAVYDLAGRLGIAAAPGARAKIVIVQLGDELTGIVVDDVEAVVAVDEERLEPPPAPGDPVVDRLVRLDDRLLIVLRADQLFAQASAGETQPPLALAA